MTRSRWPHAQIEVTVAKRDQRKNITERREKREQRRRKIDDSVREKRAEQRTKSGVRQLIAGGK